MAAVGWILIAGGVLLVAIGITILLLSAVQLYRQMFHPPTPAAPAGGAAAGGAAINVADLAKLIDAIVKIPQWLLAVLAGDMQIWLGYWLVTGTRWF